MKLLAALLIAVLSVFECRADTALHNKTDIDRLRHDLLKDYDRHARPTDSNLKTRCEVGMTLLHIDLDETRGILTSHTWLRMNWSDPKLSWDNASYNGMGHVHFQADEIWTPDVTVYNSAEANIVDHLAKTNKIVYSDGNVLWVPTAKFETYCAMDLKLWPFDIQKCIIKMGSWTYSGYALDLQIYGTPEIDIKEYYQNTEWTVLSTSAERHDKFYPCCAEPYPDITFSLEFQRRSPMFKAIVVTPAIVIVFMTLVSFWLPPQAGEKLLLNGLACVVICILLVYFSQLLPILSANSPLIVTFYSHTLYLLCFSFIISVIVINMSRNRKQYAVPHSIKSNILDGFIGKALCAAPAESAANENHSEELRETPFEEHRSSGDHKIIEVSANSVKSSHSAQSDWIRLAIIVDRFTFFVYVVLFVAMGLLHFI